MSAAFAAEQGLQVVILAGGLGTRLRGVLDDRPKILAPIGQQAFLDHLLTALAAAGVERVLLCLGYLAEKVEDHLKANPPPLPVDWVKEPKPLGTGGALRLARPRLLQGCPALVMNGDTWIRFDLAGLLRYRADMAALGALVYAQVPDVSRYGRLEMDASGYVTSFHEKDVAQFGPGNINGGVYLFSSDLLDLLAASDVVSLERDFLEKLPPRSLIGFRATGPFIDIGTPETLANAAAIVGGEAFGRLS